MRVLVTGGTSGLGLVLTAGSHRLRSGRERWACAGVQTGSGADVRSRRASEAAQL